MPLETFPDELVNQIIVELHSSVVADKGFYVSKRQHETRKAGIYWTNDHLIPLSVVNNQFRRVCLPLLFESVNILALSYIGEDEEQYHTDVKRFVRLASSRGDVSAAIRCV
jgi:hypothetical protein